MSKQRDKAWMLSVHLVKDNGKWLTTKGCLCEGCLEPIDWTLLIQMTDKSQEFIKHLDSIRNSLMEQLNDGEA